MPDNQETIPQEAEPIQEEDDIYDAVRHYRNAHPEPVKEPLPDAIHVGPFIQYLEQKKVELALVLVKTKHLETKIGNTHKIMLLDEIINDIKQKQ